jgi:formylmethanofuran:tetrahydromethanopterin formyltransferase
VNSVIFGLSADAVKEATETAINKTVGMFGLERTSAEM